MQRTALAGAVGLIVKLERGDRVRGVRLAPTKDGELLVSSAGDANHAECDITIPIEGEPPSPSRMVCVGPRYLLPALDAVDAELVELHFDSPDAPFWVCAPGEAGDGSVIMPMRV